MRRIATPTKATDLFGAGKHGFKDGDLGAGIAPTDLSAEFFNDMQEEIANVIEAVGIALSGATRTQLAAALQSGKLCTAAAAGTADAITATFNPAISSLKDGMALYVRGAAANTVVAPTFTPASPTIAAKPIVKGSNTPLAVGDIAGAGHWIELQYDLALDKWVLQNPAKGISPLSVTAAAVLAALGFTPYDAANPAGYITGAGRAFPKRADGASINWNWQGQAGQPNWLWGGNDANEAQMYVYNPSNFSVSYAASAGAVPWAGVTGKPAIPVVPGNVSAFANDSGYLTVGLGIGQAWQGLTASRAAGTTYYNTTGRPIFVYVTAGWFGGNVLTSISAAVNGVSVGNNSIFAGSASYGNPFVSFIVPSGGSYVVSISNGNLNNWSELR